MSSPTHWSLPFLQRRDEKTEQENQNQKMKPAGRSRTALIILNQPFSRPLLRRLWRASAWHCCADGGANRLHDLLLLSGGGGEVDEYIPDLIKGDLDSLRDDVRRHYEAQGVPVVRDNDQDSTDLMKCVDALHEKEVADGVDTPYDLVLLGGLTGRLDQTVHTLSYLHRVRKSGRRTFVVTDENVGWVLDEGKHRISIDHSVLGPTCGLLPVGVDSTVLTTTGLRWNLTGTTSGFDGLVSTSNHLVPEEDSVFIETSRPIWWVAELRTEGVH
ncbi:thiamine pyrophosphokinase [Russula brevipes]|nr:thiamine pyrophosphokinase [Russula brevipes]